MKKIYALIPSEREKDCDHGLSSFGTEMWLWSGRVPCTGYQYCDMCGQRKPRAA